MIANNSVKIVLSCLLTAGTAVAMAAGTESAPLRAGTSIEIPNSKGKFDFLRVDSRRHRLLAAHENDGSADFFDLQKGTLITRIKLGGAVDTAVDNDSKYYYLSVQEAKRVAVVDAETLEEVKSVKLEGPTDAIIFEPKNGMVYVTHDDGSNVWVIDPKTVKVTADIKVPGVPEFMVYDPGADRIYLNIKNKDKVAVIDPASNQVVAEWATAPASLPHGMALDAEHHRIFSAGGNGKLAVIDTQSGRVVDSTDIVPKVDQIAFDPASHLLYCAGADRMSVINTSGAKLASAGELETAASAKNVAVDPQTHAVWTTYTDGKSSYARSWLPK